MSAAHLSRITMQNELLAVSRQMTRPPVLDGRIKPSVNGVEPVRPCTLAWSPLLQGVTLTERGSDGLVIMMVAPYRQLAREGQPLRVAGVGIQAGTRDGRREPHLVVCDADQWLGPDAPQGQDAALCAESVAWRAATHPASIKHAAALMCRSAGAYRGIEMESTWDAPRTGFRCTTFPDLVEQWKRIREPDAASRGTMDMPSMAHLAWCLGAMAPPSHFTGIPTGGRLIDALADEFVAVIER